MHSNLLGKTFKATIINVIVAFFITGIIIGAIYLFAGSQIEENISLINKVSIDVENKKVEETTIDSENKIKNYTLNVIGNIVQHPEYGTQYATIEIPKINVNLPVYFGDTLEILKKGVGHSSGSYFPGEGGSIIYMGHNSTKMFRRFSELQIGNTITVKTSYGEYTYEIYDMQLIKETELDKLPIQKNEEILMVYTCYPFNNIGYATQRYVVYAKLQK